MNLRALLAAALFPISPLAMADFEYHGFTAYHFHALPRHPAILDGFEAASRAGVYRPEFHCSHFLENPKEVFAVTGTIYLFGRIQQPPFTVTSL
jgi:hypothetical protein